jgi:histidyl-tRNA synthetase
MSYLENLQTRLTKYFLVPKELIFWDLSVFSNNLIYYSGMVFEITCAAENEVSKRMVPQTKTRKIMQNLTELQLVRGGRYDNLVN